MTVDPTVPSGSPPKARKSRAIVVIALAIGVALGVFGASLVAKHSDLGLASRLWSALTGRSTSIDVSQPTVVNRIQELQRLETVVYTMDKVVTGERENPVLPDFLAGDRILLLVHGEVIAGIDLSHLQKENVKVTGKAIRLHLPDAQIFTTRLDNAKTRVYSRQTGLLVPVD